jgi:hypothetical protein
MIMLYATGALLTMMGLLFAVVGLVFGRRNAGFNRRAVEVDGVVVGNREHFSTSTAIHRRIQFPRVRYPTGDGQSLEADAPGGNEPLPEGTPVPLLYDPEHPEEVSFTGRRGSGGVAKAVGVMGCLIALGGVAMIVGTAVLMML